VVAERSSLVNEKPRISEDVRAELREELVPEAAVDAAECMLGHLLDAAETVGREYDPEIGDDPNLAGFTVARRGKNMAARELRGQENPAITVRQAPGFTWDMSADGTRLHTYSAPNGLEDFQLVGGDRKADIVERSQKQLSLFVAEGAKGPPGDLVLAYVRDRRGLRRAALGVMRSEDDFEWQIAIYNSDGQVSEARRAEKAPRGPSFREQPEKQADISLKPPREKRETL
jgi:hypothetical protein